MNKWFLTLGFLFLLLGNGFAGGPQKKPSHQQLELKTTQKLRAIESNLEQSPEEAIKELDIIIKYTIDKDLNQSMSFGYLLMGRAYNKLLQPELALHFLALAKENYSKSRTKTTKRAMPKSPARTIPSEYFIELAEVYSQMGNYEESNIQYLNYQKVEPDGGQLIPVKYAMADNFYALDNYSKAIIIYDALLEVEKQRNNELQIRECYSRLSACYISDGDIEKGLYFYNLSIQGLDQNTKFSQSSKMVQNNEVVSSALRKQNRYEEELSVRNKALQISNDGMEYLRLAQTYSKAQNIPKTESSLDQYFENISYNLIDQSEIEVIKEMALILKEERKNDKAFQYLLYYQELSDTIENRLKHIEESSKNVGFLGFKNSLQLEVLQKNKEMSENTITHLLRESELKEKNLGFQKTIIFLMGFVILIAIIALLYILRVSKQRRTANQQLALRSLQSQMNPHFIFNALNSVNSFISSSDERSANKFLTEFSTLMRTVMENSEHDFISLGKELEIIKIYLELEHFRFKDKFEFQLLIDPEIDPEEIVIPPMLIQPYIENAIWHGLRYRETKGELIIGVSLFNNKLKITVQDNGIGRAKSEELKTKNQKSNQSTALKNIQQRVNLFNSLHKVKIEVTIANLNEDSTGTLITLLIPQI